MKFLLYIKLRELIAPRLFLVATIVCSFSNLTYAVDYISGATSIKVTKSATYTFDKTEFINNFGSFYAGVWSVSNDRGTITSGQGTEQVVINFTQDGTATINLEVQYGGSPGTQSFSYTVSVLALELPPRPPAPVLKTYECANTVLKWPDGQSPDEGVTWYWQPSSSTKSTQNSESTYSVTSSGMYHLRAKNDDGWSTLASEGLSAQYHQEPVGGTTIIEIVQGSDLYEFYKKLSGHEGIIQEWKWKIGSQNWTELDKFDIEGLSGTILTKALVGNGNDCPEVYSSTRTTTILTDLQINATDISNDRMELSVDGSFSEYQWFKDGEPMNESGATIEAWEHAEYHVKVSASYGSTIGVSRPYLLSFPIKNPNYVQTTVVNEAGITSTSAINSSNSHTSITYFDRMGRTVQEVQQQASINGKDVIQHHQFDQLGRETKTFLPYVSGFSDGRFDTDAETTQSTFYSSGTDRASDNEPYSESKVERSLAARVLESGGLGEGYQVDEYSTKFEYTFNSSTDMVIDWQLDGSGELDLTNIPYYAANKLTKQTVKSPEWITGNEHTGVSFTNQLGQKILSRVFLEVKGETEHLDTYYVYDDLGRLVYIIPPEAVHFSSLPEVEYYDPNTINLFDRSQVFPAESVTNQPYYVSKGKKVTLPEGLILEEGFMIGTIPENGVVTGYDPVPDMDKLIFSNQYDAAGRVIVKKVPGADEVHYIYDNTGRLILSQDGKQRAIDRWTFTKYDHLDRPVLTGVVRDTRSRANLQSFIEGEIIVGKRYETRASDIHGYTDNVWPRDVEANDYLVVSYYDDYDFIDGDWTGFSHDTNNGINNDDSLPMPRGLETGGKIRVLGSTNWLQSIKYYDEDLQLIQGISDHHRGFKEKVYTDYNWRGEIVKTRFVHEVDAAKSIILDERFVYDDNSRLIEQYHSIDNEPEILIASMSYNELGELIEKDLHQQDDNSFVQSVDYRYNIRGQLTHINKANRGVHPGDIDDNPDRFGMNLYYDSSPTDLSFDTDDPTYLAGTVWSHSDMESERRAYGYSYDEANRLTAATYNEKADGSWGTKSNHFNVSDISYDRNGNIKTLNRRHENTLVDELEYSYDGNRLWHIDDLTNHDEGFNDGAESPVEYTFDENGNMTSDANKLITSIDYNMLNKPQTITFSNGDHIDYTYDAAGTRLRMSVTTGSDTYVTDYSSGLIYEDDELTLIAMPQGRIVVEKVAADYNYDYQYHLTDHLGNTRSTVAPVYRVFEATMETESATVENNLFLNLDDSRHLEALYARSGDESAKLNANNDQIIGPAKALKLYAGDVVDLKVFARYQSTTAAAQATTSLMIFDALASAYGFAGSGEIFNAFQGQFSAASLLAQSPGDVPAAYLNYIFYDRNYENPQIGLVQVSSAAESNFEELTLSVVAPTDGYLYTYLSNESSLDVDVYFDDYRVTHTSSAAVMQADDYYPFGLPIAGNKTEDNYSKENRFLYQGKEWQTALSLNLYDFHARQYDPAIGLFTSVDPKAEKFAGMSPFTGMGNMPTVGVDPDGEAWFVPLIIGAVINTVANKDNIDNFWDGLGYAAVGAASAYVGNTVAGADIIFSNTLALAGASTLSSTGNYLVNGMEGDIYTSFGGVSMNWTQNDFGYLGEKGNSGLENFGYALGALANLADINQVINSTDATLYTEKSDAISHSAVVDDKTGKTLMSYGPDDNKIGGTPPSLKDRIPAAKPVMRNAGGYKKFGLAIRKSTSDYHVYADLPVDITVNKHTVGLVRSLGKVLPYQGCTVNCTNMASLSLWLNGIPNIGIHPYFLYGSTWAYSNGIRVDLFSHHLQNHE